MTCQASPTQDARFVPGLYRVPCKTTPIPGFAQTGAESLQMVFEGTNFFGRFEAYFGNTVTIYVKPH
jgi:hypothetical protein